jgi:hypothetical protein
MIITEENRARTACIDWLAEQATAYHLTLTFPPHTNHKSTKQLLDLFLTHLNRRIFSRRYSSGKSFIKGVAIREESQQHNTEHYHLMLFDEESRLPDYDRLHSLIEREIARLTGDYFRNFIKRYRLQEYINTNGTDGLEKYLTKNFYNPSYSLEKAIASIGVLTEGKTIFGIDFSRTY